jgi:microsomal dipeptidase-like Zn-dependent dipeptidase
MLADLHCHYPMHLLPDDRHPHKHSTSWLRRLRDEVEASLVDIVGHALSNPNWGDDWRISLDGLVEGEARIVCSVLYSPADEFDLDNPHYDAPPEPGYFADVEHQIELVKHDLHALDPEGERHRIAKRGEGLADDGRVTFVHCVEGGFHFGPDLDAIDGQVKRLADQGVVYITVAHLFFRGVGASAPAIPKISDEWYERLFHQDAGVGLTEIGERLVRAMYDHDVLVDISHMRQDTIDETFDLIEKLDEKHGKNPPVVATHVGARAVVGEQGYNLNDATIKRIADRGGLVGMIMAQHQLGETSSEAEAKAVLKKHADAIAAAAGGHQCTAIGSDLDGFIKPTLEGIDNAPDLKKLADWIHELYPRDADAILYKNAQKVVGAVLA